MQRGQDARTVNFVATAFIGALVAWIAASFWAHKPEAGVSLPPPPPARRPATTAHPTVLADAATGETLQTEPTVRAVPRFAAIDVLTSDSEAQADAASPPPGLAARPQPAMAEAPREAHGDSGEGSTDEEPLPAVPDMPAPRRPTPPPGA